MLMLLKKYTFPFLLFILFLTSSFSIYAGTIKGHVLDANSKEGLAGAIVFRTDSMQMNDVAGLDGSYTLKNLKPGTYSFSVQFTGYTKQQKQVTIKDDKDIVNADFALSRDSVTLKGVTIETHADQESDNFARLLEKNSDNMLNIMSAKTIQLLPDVTIGDVLQRVSGVTVEKSITGGGKYAIIRGMDKRYNYTTINGIKIPSPDFKNRYIPMDIFPSEIIERLEVIKTLTPSMEGDAIGGVTNLVLKHAPETFILNADIGTGYSQMLFDHSFTELNTSQVNFKSPEQIHGNNVGATMSDFPMAQYNYSQTSPAPDMFGGFTVGNRFFNDKLGVLVSANYQNTYSSTTSLFISPSAQPNYSPSNQPVFDDIEARRYSIQQKRGALHANLDYRFNKNHKLSFYTVYVSLDQLRQRRISDTIANINVGEVDQHYETRITYQNIYNSSLHGEDSIGHHLLFDWTGAYSRAAANTPDWGTLTTTGSAFNSSETWQGFTRRWMQNTDQDVDGYGNLTYKFNLFGQGVELKGGGMYRNKTRVNFYDEYRFNFAPNQQATDINTALISVANPFGSSEDPNNYTVTENITAYYGQAKLSIGPKVQLLGGIRVENTYQSYITNEPESIPGKTGTIQYSDMLPSAEIKYAITPKQNIRASYFASISRPSFFEIVPYTLVGEYFDEMGNPYLHHTQADNFDLRYEFFPKPSEQILAGVFYKNIVNPIEYAFDRVSISTLDLIPENFGNATNYGFEFVATKYIKRFGISANYTYTKSEITTDKELYYHDPIKGNTNITVTETRPLQGQADHIANLSLIYKEPKLGLEMLISAVYTGKLISQVSPDYGLDYWQMPMTRLDFSFQKRISKKYHLTLYGKVNNILNTPLTVRILQPNPYTTPGASYLPEQNDPKSILVEKEVYGQSYFIGLRYKFQE
jgi:outer membrane receptor protein involved in Fe transport